MGFPRSAEVFAHNRNQLPVAHFLGRLYCEKASGPAGRTQVLEELPFGATRSQDEKLSRTGQLCQHAIEEDPQLTLMRAEAGGVGRDVMSVKPLAGRRVTSTPGLADHIGLNRAHPLLRAVENHD
jgi:hypothetical protein